MTTYIEELEAAAENAREEVLGGPWNGMYDGYFVQGFELGGKWAGEREPSEDEARAAGMAIAAHVHNEDIEHIATVYDALDRSGSYTDQGRAALRGAARARKEQDRG